MGVNGSALFGAFRVERGTREYQFHGDSVLFDKVRERTDQGSRQAMTLRNKTGEEIMAVELAV